jgi:hypothetical protein
MLLGGRWKRERREVEEENMHKQVSIVDTKWALSAERQGKKEHAGCGLAGKKRARGKQ